MKKPAKAIVLLQIDKLTICFPVTSSCTYMKITQHTPLLDQCDLRVKIPIFKYCPFPEYCILLYHENETYAIHFGRQADVAFRAKHMLQG